MTGQAEAARGPTAVPGGGIGRWPSLAERPAAVPLLYLTAIGLAEVVTAATNPQLGLLLHALLLFGLLVQGAATGDEGRRALLWGLALAPLIRMMSLSLPLSGLPLVGWYALISVPIFASTAVAARTLGYGWRELGLAPRWRLVPLDLGLLVLGFGLGLVEYLILEPRPLARELTVEAVWLPALILTVSTGLEEELIFRGLLQRAAVGVLGVGGGLVYVSALFAVLHTGYLSVTDLAFVFAVGLFFAVVARRSGSIVGVTLCHAGVNVSMFLFWPFVLPRILAG